jgi:hypothetical protein
MTSFPLSLYIDLEEGQQADLEVAARAAISWAQSIKETAYVFDPTAEVKVKFISGTEGSLSLNGAIEFFRRADKKAYIKTTAAAALLSSVWHVVGVTTDYLTEAVLETMEAERIVYFAAEKVGIDISDEVSEMSQEDINRIADRIVQELKNRDKKEQSKQIIRELQRDPSVRGVGITPYPGVKPENILRREDFGSATSSETGQETKDTRYQTVEQKLRLVGPRIVEDDKVWRFQGPDGEHGYYLNDDEFKYRFTHGQLDLDFDKDVIVNAVVRYYQEKQNGVWVIKRRYIIQVLRYENESKQANLFPEQNSQGDDTDENR